VGAEVYLHSFLTWAVDGGEWLTSRPGRFTPGKKTGSGRTSQPVWTFWRTEKYLVPTENFCFYYYCLSSHNRTTKLPARSLALRLQK